MDERGELILKLALFYMYAWNGILSFASSQAINKKYDKILETDSAIDKKPGRTWSHQ